VSVMGLVWGGDKMLVRAGADGGSSKEEKNFCILDANHSVSILSYVLILDPLSYNNIGGF
jgi:hypothetical protein